MNIYNKPCVFTYNEETFSCYIKEKDENNNYVYVLKNMENGEETINIIKNYSDGSGNENLVGSLEYKACMELAIRMYELVFNTHFKRKM